jgi:hypothetical protein
MFHKGISYDIQSLFIHDDSMIGIQGRLVVLQVDRGSPCNLSRGVISDFSTLLDTLYDHIYMSIFSLHLV